MFRISPLSRRLVCVAILGLGLIAGRAEDEACKVCWWNVENFGVTDRYIDNRLVAQAMKPESEIRAVMAILARLHPDILGVAEVLQEPDDKYVKSLRTKLREAGLDYPYASTTQGRDPRIQLVLFSRFPIVSEEPFNQDTFPVTIRSAGTGETMLTSYRVNRGFVNAKIQVRPDFSLQVMLAHLKSRRAEMEVLSDTPGESGDGYVRRQEAQLLKKHMNDFIRKNPVDALLVMGDLNDVSTSPAVKIVLGPKDAPEHVRDLWLKDYFGDWWTHFYYPEKSYQRIDYVLVNDPLFHRFVADRSFIFRPQPEDGKEYDTYAASDHRPLLVTFRLSASSP